MAKSRQDNTIQKPAALKIVGFWIVLCDKK